MNPWKILGVNRAMKFEEIRDAYLALAKKHHPDASGTDQQFSVMTGAYALLKDEKKLKAFLTQMKAIGKPCVPCKGQGATFKQKGMTARVATTCKQCSGSGYILKGESK